MFDKNLELELFKLIKEYRQIESMSLYKKDTQDILDKLAIFLTENSWKLYGRNDVYSASDVFAILNSHRVKPFVDKLCSFNDNESYKTIERDMYDFRKELKRANTNVLDEMDYKQTVNKIIIAEIVDEVKHIIRYRYNKAPNLTAYIRSTIFTDEDRKALSEEVTDLWVVSMIQSHHLFVMDLLDDKIVPNSLKDIANLAQFIYACIGEGQTIGQISDIARSITKKSNNENANDVDFGGGYTESKPEFILMDKNHHDRCFHFERDKTNEYKYYILQFEVKVFYEDTNKDYVVRKHVILDEDGIRKNILYVYKNILYMIIGDKLYDIAVMDDKILGYSVRVYKSTANYISEKFKNSSILSDNNAFEYMEYIEFKKD